MEELKLLILENRHHVLTRKTWDALNVNANRTKTMLRNTKDSNHEVLLGERNLTRNQLLGLVTWTVLRRNVWNFLLTRKKYLGNYTKSQTLSETLKILNQLGWSSVFVGRRTFVPENWTCIKQTSVPHNSTKSEVISLERDEIQCMRSTKTELAFLKA